MFPDTVAAMKAGAPAAASLPAQAGLDWLLLLHLGESSKSKQLTSSRRKPASIIARLRLGPTENKL